MRKMLKCEVCVSGFVVCADDTASETQLKQSRQVHETISFQCMKTHNDLADAIVRTFDGHMWIVERKRVLRIRDKSAYIYIQTNELERMFASDAALVWCLMIFFPLRFVWLAMKRVERTKRTAQYVRNCAIVYRFYVINFNDVIDLEGVSRPKWLAFAIQRGTILVLEGSEFGVCISCGRLLYIRLQIFLCFAKFGTRKTDISESECGWQVMLGSKTVSKIDSSKSVKSDAYSPGFNKPVSTKHCSPFR